MPVSSWGGSQTPAVETQPAVPDRSGKIGGKSGLTLPNTNETQGKALTTAANVAAPDTALKAQTASAQAKSLKAAANSQTQGKSLSPTETSASREIDKTLNLVGVTATRLAKEGALRLGEYSRWFDGLFKQRQAPPVITPAAANYGMRRLSRAEPVTPKHPLWMLRDGRLKTVTVQ